MIQFEPVYLPVKVFRDSAEVQKAVELLQRNQIMVVVERHAVEPFSEVYRITVQPIFWVKAQELLKQFDTEITYLIKKDSTVLWTTMLMIFFMMLFLVVFPYERDPMNISIFFILSLLPGLIIGQKRIRYNCVVCGEGNHPDGDRCVRCSRMIKGIVDNPNDIPDRM